MRHLRNERCLRERSPLFDTPDLVGQHRILNEIASLVDEGVLRTTMTQCLSPFSVENLSKGHRPVESRAGIGKIVMSRVALDRAILRKASATPSGSIS
jgi:hypothetical protein